MPMKKIFKIGVVVTFFLAIGCTNREAEARKMREDAEAKARAEAARKEMETLPKAFQTPDYFKKNEPAKNEPPAAEEEKANP